MLPSWRSNSAGLINFHNPTAVTNSGCLLEVLLTAAVKNAAAKAVGNIYCTGVDFILQLMDELGLLDRGHSQSFKRDSALSGIRVPQMLLLTQEKNGHQFASMKDILGVAERQRDSDEFDLLVKGVGSAVGDSIRLEAKDRADLHNGEMAKAASKLFLDGNRVGVIVVRNCCQYWRSASLNESNRAKLRDLLQMIPGLGVAYLFSKDRDFESIQVSPRGADSGRLIVIQVPERSLRESYQFASADD